MSFDFTKLKSLSPAKKAILIAVTGSFPLMVAFTNCAPPELESAVTKKSSNASSSAIPSSPLTSVPQPATAPGTGLINGQCANYSGVSLATAPSSNLCASGTASGMTALPSAWQWNCLGSNGGTTATSCMVMKSTTAGPAVGAAPSAAQSAIVLGVPDEFIRINTGVPLNQDVFVCVQNDSDSSYPGVNGAIETRFTPANFNNGTSKVWLSQSLYADPAADFGDFTVIVMKKNANGVLSDVVGNLKVTIRLPELGPNQYWSGSPFTSTGGANKIYALCNIPNVAFTLPAGYKAYPYYQGKECYYKFVR